MKKWISILLILCLLLSLGACGGKTESVPSVSAKETEPIPSVELAADGDYVIPAQWTNNSINDGNYAYVTEAAEQLLINDGLGHRYQINHDDEKQVSAVTVTKLDGTPMYSLEIPFLAPITEGDMVSDYLGEYVFLEDSLWVTHYRDSYDPGQETSSWEGYLEHWDAQGNQLEKRSLSEDYGVNQEDNFLMALTLGKDGGLLMVSQKELLFLDETGEITARSDVPQDSWLTACRDSSGRAYLFDNMSTDTLYTIDWENHTLGKPLFSADSGVRILPGGGDYDFFLVSETMLSGATLATGTVTEILRWVDYALTASVGSVEYVDEDTFRISVSSIMGDPESLYLRRVPASEVPEKETIYLAYPLAEIEEVPDRSWTEVADYTLIEPINRFNRSSAEYRIEVVTFGSATDLQLLMQSDTPPDLICWDGDWVGAPPSARIYASKGYLADLEPLLEQDEEFSLDDLIPRCVELLRETYGGMYVLPYAFYARTIMAPREYVGDDMGWTLEEFCNVANSLPDDVTLWSSGGDTLLSMILSTSENQFVDYEAGTCDFENQTFIDLLNVCRDRCTEGDDTEDDMLQVIPIMGPFAGFTYDNLLPARAAGKTMIGYPGAKGNGMCLTFQQCMSITASAKHPDVAWQFLRTFLSDDLQGETHIFTPIREDVYQKRENDMVKNHPDEATQEEYAEAIAMPYDAGCVMIYDDPAMEIALEEAAAFFAGDKTAEDTASVIQSRVSIYLGEQS